MHQTRVLGSGGALHDTVDLVAEAVLRSLRPRLDLLRGSLCGPPLRDGRAAEIRLGADERRKRVEERADGVHARRGGVRTGMKRERLGTHIMLGWNCGGHHALISGAATRVRGRRTLYAYRPLSSV